MKLREFYLCGGQMFRYVKGAWWHLDEFDKGKVIKGAADPQCGLADEDDVPISRIYARLKGWPE